MYTISNFSFTYPNGVTALKNISLQINKGDFIILCGPNGGGKSTLLKSMLGVIPEYTGGKVQGHILYQNIPVADYKITRLAGNVGIVLQDPEKQITNLSVLEEAGFGVGNLGLPVSEIYERVEWALNKVQMFHLVHSSVFSLSGGQMQRLSIASLMAMKPKILLLDEPLASLDPHGVADVVTALNELRNIVDAVVVTSHWLDPFLDLASRVVVISDGSLKSDFSINELGKNLSILEQNAVEIPHTFRINQVLQQKGVTLTAETNDLQNISFKPLPLGENGNQKPVVTGKNLSIVFPTGESPFSSINFTISKGDRLGLVGRNGAGKTTLTRLIAGLLKPTFGQITRNFNKAGLVLQNPGFGFLTTSVLDEIRFGTDLSEAKAIEVLEKYGLSKYKKHSPFEISGGQQRILALAIAQVANSDLLLLDEPTAGLDNTFTAFFRNELINYSGTVLFISHDPRVIGVQVEKLIVLGDGGVLYQGGVRRLNKELVHYLGYPLVNPTVRLTVNSLNYGFPFIPEELEVENDSSL